MSNIMSHMQAARDTAAIKQALAEIGCNVGDMNDLSDVANIIRTECLSGPVLNATLTSGPGIKIIPQGKTGYKIGATSGAALESDLTDELPKGTSVQKALHTILYKALPRAMKAAAGAPAIVRLDLVKVAYDGVDYYENPAFGPKGTGRRSALTPDAWYLRVFTHQMKEPFYLDLSPVLSDFGASILSETRRMIDSTVMKYMENHISSEHRPSFPGTPSEPSEPIDPEFGIPVCPPHNHHHHCHGGHGHHHHCGCDKDHSFGGWEDPLDPEFGVPSEPTDSTDPDIPWTPIEPSEPIDPVDPDYGIPVNPNDLNGDGLCDDCGLPLKDAHKPTAEELEIENLLKF